MKRVLRPWWWLLDYLYAGWRQLIAVFRREAPSSYADGDPALPAIVLLPGVYETWLFLEPSAQRLNAAGHGVFTVPGLGTNRRPIPESAEIVRQRLAALSTEHGIERCILLAHSKGGLIGKYLMLDAAAALEGDAGGHHPVEIMGLVAIGTPFSGSIYARYTLSRTIRHFSPTDAVLLSLKNQEAVNDRVVSVFPEFDPHIPGGSALAGALNIELPVSGHFRTLRSGAVLDAVDEAVEHLSGACGPPAGCA
ncbi:esterase/lipase family protein [Paeniglutamicibacter sp. NPDC012692]|uniref:esterase/lipase family protein n=1 Tax=Paeniglutamicibacter sp. NPDC012692 TaxID=3364388 RepID=UPI0036CB4F64